MKTERKIMAAAIALGLTIWFIDAVQDYLFFYEGSFWDLLIANIPPHEFVIRAFWLVCVLLLGAVMTGFIRERQQREEQLTAALVRAEQRQAETAALLSASKEVLKHRSFADAARAIFAHSREIIGAPAGYISLSSEDGTQNEVVFLEAGGLPCAVDPATPMPIRGLRAKAYKKGQPVFDNHFSQSVHAEFLPEGHVKLENVLFAPLLFQEKAVGLLGLANKPGGFTGHDAVLASGFAELAAIALVTKRHEEERERLIRTLGFEPRPDRVGSPERGFDQGSLRGTAALPGYGGEDITGRKQAEEALRQNQELFQQIGENTREFIFVRDIEATQVLYANPAYEHIWGRTVESLQQHFHSFLDGVHPEDRDRVVREVDQHSRGEIFDHEYRIVRPDGEIRWVQAHIFPIRNEQGAIYRIGGVVEDVTARKETEEALQRAHEELDRRVQERTLELSRTVEKLRVEIEERQTAEAKLRDSEARFRTLLQTAGSYIVTMTPDGRIMEFNQEAERVTGWTRQELAGKPGFDLFLSPENQARVEGEMAKLLAGEIIRGFELPIRLRDGSERVYLWNANIIAGADGHPPEIIAVGQDITQRKRAEEALREQSRLLEAFFEHTITPLGFLDKEFTFIRVNKAYARACHRQAEDFPSRRYFELFPDEEKEALFLSVIQTQAPYQVLAQPFTFPDHPEWGVTYWDWSLVPVLDDQGAVDFLVFSLNDVTQRVLAEEKKARLHEIIEATPDLVGTADTKGRVFYINQAGRRMLGLSPDEDLSRAVIADFHPPEVAEFIYTQAIPASKELGVWQGETRLRARDGREIPVSQVILAHHAPEGGIRFFSTIARDISDMKQAEQKLRMLTSRLLTSQENERRRLSRELHDELGQSLLVLKMQTRTIERQLPEGQEILREDCSRALKYIDEIIENVRRLSRDLSPSLLEDLGLSAALNYLFEEFRRHHQNIQFFVEQERVDEYLSKAEQTNIFRVLQEALTNIAKHAQATQVRVSLKKRDKALVGRLEDNGLGFEPAEVAAREGLDKGLGLAAMDERLRIIGGSLHIASEKGKGTSIAFEIPLN